MKSIQALCAAIYIVSISSSIAGGATVILQPPELSPGDPYRLVFVSSGVRDARSKNIADYNEFVQALADQSPLAVLNQQWKAIASTETAFAHNNTETNPSQATHLNIPIYRVDGLLVAETNGELWSGTLRNPIRTDEFGNLAPVGPEINTTVWTGTTISGNAGSGYLGDQSAIYGSYDYTNNPSWYWIQRNSTLIFSGCCYQTGRYYAMSGVIYAAVPEPTSAALASIAIAFFGVWATIGRHQNRSFRQPSHSVITAK